MSVDYIETGAVLSECGKYRYQLWRRWGPAGGSSVLFVMLNPSTADAHDDDPTIRKCVAFARRWGFGGIEVANLFAFRATDPAVLPTVADPIGPAADRHLTDSISRASRIVVAWGANAEDFPDRARTVRAAIGDRAEALRLTKAGHPWHPLYLPLNLTPMPLPALSEPQR